ncbi:hypothetical protein WEH80_37185 [Actinomycetes bacterium KLBMP 9759]
MRDQVGKGSIAPTNDLRAQTNNTASPRRVPLQAGPDSANSRTFVFDVLALEGVDLRGEPYRTRRKHLRQLLGYVAAPLALMPATRALAGAQAWLREHADVGMEGVVVKDRSRGYRPGRTH